MSMELCAVIRDDARRFLAAMLQRVQAQSRQRAGFGVTENPEDTAFLVEMIVVERICGERGGTAGRNNGIGHLTPCAWISWSRPLLSEFASGLFGSVDFAAAFSGCGGAASFSSASLRSLAALLASSASLALSAALSAVWYRRRRMSWASRRAARVRLLNRVDAWSAAAGSTAGSRRRHRPGAAGCARPSPKAACSPAAAC